MSIVVSGGAKQPSRIQRYNPQRSRVATAADAVSSNDSSSSDRTESEGSEQAEGAADWMALVSLLLGAAGLMLRYKLCAWLAVFACLSSIVNQRRRDMDFKQIICSLLFSIMGLLMNYVAPRPAGATSDGVGVSPSPGGT